MMLLVLVGTWWYWVNINWYCLILSGSGLVYCGNGWYLVVLGQKRAALVVT